MDLAFLEKGGGVQLLKGGGGCAIFFDGGDYVAELVDSPRKFLKF